MVTLFKLSEWSLEEEETLISDSTKTLKQINSDEPLHLIWDFEDIALLKNSKKTWKISYYKSDFILLITLIIKGVLLNKELKIYIKEILRFKEILKVDLNLKNLKVFF